MNLFRSEDHVRKHVFFDPGAEDGMMPLPDLLRLFSVEYFRRRLDPDYFSQRSNYRSEMLTVLKQIGKTGRFWRKPG